MKGIVIRVDQNDGRSAIKHDFKGDSEFCVMRDDGSPAHIVSVNVTPQDFTHNGKEVVAIEWKVYSKYWLLAGLPSGFYPTIKVIRRLSKIKSCIIEIITDDFFQVAQNRKLNISVKKRRT